MRNAKFIPAAVAAGAALIAAYLAVAPAACSSGTESQETACTPAAQSECKCFSSGLGTRTCGDDGQWGKCEGCPAGGGDDAGAADGEGSDAGGSDAGTFDGGKPPAYCGALDPGTVYLLGVIVEGDGHDAIAQFAHPEQPCIGLATHDEYAASIRPDGRVVWKHWNDDLLFVYVPDLFQWDASSKYASQPADPQQNDIPIPTPMCDADAGPITVTFFVDPTDGSVVYRCRYGGAWYDGGGKVVAAEGIELAKVGTYGLKLASSTPANSGCTLVDVAGTETPVTGPDGDILGVRAHQNGFWMVNRPLSSTDLQLWQVDGTGQALQLGTYASVPAAAVEADERIVLDGDGNAYQLGHDAQDTMVDVVIKHPLGPAESMVVYTEKGLPDNDFQVYPPKVCVRIHISGLITGP